MIALEDAGTQHIYCADANYFKVLTKKTKAEPYLGYTLPCAMEGFEHMTVTLGINYRALLYNPLNEDKLNLSLRAYAQTAQGQIATLGKNIIHEAHYPNTITEIDGQLRRLHQHKILACDIETFSLRPHLAGIATIGFAWSRHAGTAFCCDYVNDPLSSENQGKQSSNDPVRQRLKDFLATYEGTLIFHNASFDIKVLIYVLWMEHPHDIAGLLEGLHCMCRHMEDTKLLAYLSLNSCAGNVLSLKDLAHEFAGNWAQSDIDDVRKIPKKDLLQYNLVDCLSTFYLYEKYYPIMVKEQQLAIYTDLFLPSQKVIIQMELIGLPLEPSTVENAKERLEEIVATHNQVITQSAVIKQFNRLLQQQAMESANAKLKTKQHPIEHFKDIAFNPGSSKQLQQLLYTVMGLPVLAKTKSKQPATDGDTLAKLVNHTNNPEYVAIINALLGMTKAQKILSAFIPAFEQGFDKKDGRLWLQGNFNLGGTKSGRLSSSDPNLQNIPSGSTYGKLVKECIQAPDDWIFCGADFSSLEDYISALTTKDPNKLKVYLDKFDGHCLRAYSYFKSRMPDIRQADPADQCYRIVVSGQTIYAKAGDRLKLPDGRSIPVEQYREATI